MSNISLGKESVFKLNSVLKLISFIIFAKGFLEFQITVPVLYYVLGCARHHRRSIDSSLASYRKVVNL